MPSRARNRILHEDECARWLSTLPEGLREQALENRDRSFGDYSDNPEDLADAIMHAFQWSDTPDGHDFWSRIHDNAEGGEYDA